MGLESPLEATVSAVPLFLGCEGHGRLVHGHDPLQQVCRGRHMLHKIETQIKLFLLLIGRQQSRHPSGGLLHEAEVLVEDEYV